MAAQKLLIGLGNPGPEYKNTRHSVGHFVVESLGEVPGFVSLLSSTYMNNSGTFVLDSLRKYKLTPENLVVVHDDWAFEVGEFRLQINRNANRHNGVLDIIEKLGTKSFWRLRIGIGEDETHNNSKSEYVLSRFSQDEKNQISDLIDPIRAQLRSLQ